MMRLCEHFDPCFLFHFPSRLFHRLVFPQPCHLPHFGFSPCQVMALHCIALMSVALHGIALHCCVLYLASSSSSFSPQPSSSDGFHARPPTHSPPKSSSNLQSKTPLDSEAAAAHPSAAALPLDSSTSAASDANLLWSIVPRVRQRIIDSFSAEQRAAFESEFSFFDAVTNISGVLRPVPKEKRREAIRP